MTTYHLNLTLSERGSGLHTTGGGPSTRTLASLDTDDPAVMAATLRAVADRLDPPRPAQPAYRGETPSEGLARIAAAERRAERGDTGTVRVDGFDQSLGKGAALSRVMITVSGRSARLSPRRARLLAAEIVACADKIYTRVAKANGVPLGDQTGSGVYAHDADCNMIHEAGPEPCPPPRIVTPAQIDGPLEVRTYQHAVNDGNEIDTPAGRMTPNRIDVHFRGGRFERLIAFGSRRPMSKGARVEAEWTPDTVDGPKPLPGDLRHLTDPSARTTSGIFWR